MTLFNITAEERIYRLTQRIKNLREGAGEYNAARRALAIKHCEQCLERAREDLGRAH